MAIDSPSDRTDSLDSTFNLRHNPLNIRNSDGSDFLLNKKKQLFLNSNTSSNDLPSSRSSTDLLIHSLLNNAGDDDLPPSMRIEREKTRRQELEEELEKIKKEEEEMEDAKRVREIERARLALEGASLASRDPSVPKLQPSADIKSIKQEPEPASELKHSDLELGNSSNDSAKMFHDVSPDNSVPILAPRTDSMMLNVKSQSETKADIYKLLDINLGEQDLSTTIMDQFEEMSTNTGLVRSNTITSQQRVKVGPSQTPALFDRTRHVRAKISRVFESNDIDELSIPTPLLNAISFTPGPPANLSASSEEDRCPSLASSGAGSYRNSRVEFHTPPEADLTAFNFSTRPSSYGALEHLQVPRQVPKIKPKSPKLADLAPAEPKIENVANDAESLYCDADDDDLALQPPSPEIESSPTLAELDPVDPNDRGRLFLKINALRELRMSMDYDRNPHFTLTLDNGIQSVRTYPIKFPQGKQSELIPISQEFELLVGEKLELILTLSGHMDPLPAPPARSVPSSPKKSPESPKKKRFSLFSSPKKKKERRDSVQSNASGVQITPEQKVKAVATEASRDVWKHVAGNNGEFARAYIDETEFEHDIYGKPQTYLVSCFNEWSMEKVPVQDEETGAVRGFKLAKKPPYRIGGLQVTMMYIPRVTKAEQIPKSMKECVAQLENSAQFRDPNMNGCLTQQGGDCNYWRRRWFSLDGDSLTGHTEEGRKVRNIINMGNVKDVIEMDKVKDEEDPCINAERAFRLIFKDNEKVSFYADSIEEKENWVRCIRLSMVHCCGKVRSWTDLVFQRQEEDAKQKTNFAQRYNHHLRQTQKYQRSRFVECEL